MKAQAITALFVAAGFLTNAALADNSTSPPVTVQQATPAQTIYAPQLPTIAELTSAAAAQGVTIKQITQSAREVSITTQSADGQTKLVSYQLLADAAVNPVPVAAPTVVYAAPPGPVYYYYDPYDPYYSACFYPPVSVRFGLGFGFRRGDHGFHRGGHGFRGRRW